MALIPNAQKSIPLNNDKFTHLLALRELLLSKSFNEFDNFCKNDLLETFENNGTLLINILFYGMQKMLFQIDIKTINQFINNINKLSTKKLKQNINKNNINKDKKDDKETVRKTLCDIPYDVMSYVICKYLDISTLISFEKVSKLFLSRSRDAALSSFHFNLTNFLSYDNTSYDLMRFKNTKKLSIFLHDDSQYSFPQTRVTRPSSNDDNIPLGYMLTYDNNYYNDNNHDNNHNNINLYDSLYHQLSHFANLDNSNVVSSKTKTIFSKQKFNLIFSQFKSYHNLQWLKLEKSPCDSHWMNLSYVMDRLIPHLPNLEFLSRLKILELKQISSQPIFELFDIHKNVNHKNTVIMIKELRLHQVTIHSSSLKIINDCMLKLETIYFNGVTLNSNGDINIDKLLTRLKCLIFCDSPDTGTSTSRFLIELFLKGDNKRCSHTAQPNQNTNNFTNFGRNNTEVTEVNDTVDVKLVERNCLQVLHFHSKVPKCVLSKGMSQYPDLIRLCIDCKDFLSPTIEKIITKCKSLKYLSLIIHQMFVNQINEKQFGDFCDSFMYHQYIKHLRIKEYNSRNVIAITTHTSSKLVVLLIKYIRKISKWKKLSSFQFISCKALEHFVQETETRSWVVPVVNNNFDNNHVEREYDETEILNFNKSRAIKRIIDVEEFCLLKYAKNIISDDHELILSFIGIDSNDFARNNAYALQKLNVFCKKPENKYRIKICGSERPRSRRPRSGQGRELWDIDDYNDESDEYKESNFIKIQVGKWNDAFHKQNFGNFAKWKHDCFHRK